MTFPQAVYLGMPNPNGWSGQSIVDLVESGQTLKQNGLAVIEVIEKITSILIINKTSYKVNRKQIDNFLNKLNLE